MDSGYTQPELTPPVIVPSPAEPPDRLPQLDILRGAAVFGILLVNISHFKSPSMPFMPASGSPLDRWADAVISLLVEGKFYPVFVFLFGMGLAMQSMRLEARGIRATPVVVRRLLILLCIGVAHAVLIWSGDILAIYALAGLVLLWLQSVRPKTLLLLAIALWGMQLFFCGVPTALLLALHTQADVQEVLTPANDALAVAFQEMANSALQAYGQGTYLEALRYRVIEWIQIVFGYTVFILNIAGVFLLGMYVAHMGLLHDLNRNNALWRKIALVAIPVGLAANTLYAYTVTFGGVKQSITALLSAVWLNMSFGPVLSLGYIALFALFLRSPQRHKPLHWLKATGRMALSNYLLQSVVCTLVFYNYGLGLYGKVGAATGLLMACVLFSLQALLSVWWLRRYRFGPVEWLWRTLTYRRRQPMRLQA